MIGMLMSALNPLTQIASAIKMSAVAVAATAAIVGIAGWSWTYYQYGVTAAEHTRLSKAVKVLVAAREEDRANISVVLAAQAAAEGRASDFAEQIEEYARQEGGNGDPVVCRVDCILPDLDSL